MSEKTLVQYYKSVFPFEAIWKWLNTEDDETIYHKNNREFCMVSHDEVWSRYCHFETLLQLKEKVIKTVPTRLEIGAIYNVPPDKQTFSSLESLVFPVSKQLVFDLDGNDYGPFRSHCECKEEKKVCQKCWHFIASAAQCLHYYLTQCLGYKQILFVFSGRRGLHCWVSDKAARALPSNIRSDIANFFTELPNADLRNPHVKYMYKHFLRPAYTQYYGEEPQSIKICLEKMKPRLDLAVTCDLRHLVKCPFVIHPATNAVCVPLSLDDIAEFNPEFPPLRINTEFDLDDLDEEIKPFVRILESSYE